jgi:DNA polymerase-3 subunit delta
MTASGKAGVMKPQELGPAVKRAGLAPLYLILGEEDCLRDQAVSAIKQAVLGEGTEGNNLEAFSYDLLYGDETDAAELLAHAGEVSVFAERRLVLVKAAEKLPAREGEKLLPYLAAPCDTTTVVFVAAKLDGRLKFAQALKERAFVVDCSSLPEGRLPSWIGAEAGRMGVRLTEDAILLLKEYALSLKDQAGGCLGLVQRELEKLAAYVPEGRVAGPAEVEALRAGEAGASAFDLSAAIAARDRGRVLRIAARNMEAGEAPIRMLGSLTWQYRRIWKVKELLRQGGTESEAARLLRIPPFRVRQFLGQFSDQGLRSAFRLFQAADSKLKGGSQTAPERVLEATLLGLCADQGPAGAGDRGRSRTPGSGVPSSPVKGEVRSWRPSTR